MMLHIENVLPDEELAKIRALLAEADFADGRITAGYRSAVVKNNLQLAEDSPVAVELGKRVIAALERCPQFYSATLPRHIYPPLFNCYAEGMAFGEHVDNALRGAVHPIRTDLSVTLFLSAPEDYDGGELIVSDTFGTHHVKLPAGDLVLYPASSLHRVASVNRGKRLACFFWIQSLIRNDAQRTLLYELDQAIMALHNAVPNGGEHPELLRLSACYHNLLRFWAEV